jgi:DNA-binding CsgD family transcriptional regulator
MTLQQPVLVRPLILTLQDAEFDDDSFLESYLTCFSEEDPFPYHQLEAFRIYNVTELLGQDWRQGAYYRDFLEPFGLHELLLVRLEVKGALNAYLFVARSKDQETFCEQDIALIERLLPDLGQALHVSSHIRRLEAERKIYEQAVEGMGIGTILLGAAGQVIYVDLLARQLLADQSILVLRDARLSCERPAQRQHLQELIDRALSDRTGTLSRALSLTSRGEELLLLVRAVAYPLSVSNEPGPRVAIFVSDRSARPTLRREVISQLFGLSPAETDLAIKLAEGASLAEAAHLLEISEHTARTYSKRIYSKTGTSRQAELVKVILGSVARV